MHTITKLGLRAALGATCLLLATPGLTAQDRDYAAEVTALQKEYEQARKDWMSAYRAASAEDRQKLATEQPGPEFVPRFKEVADAAAGTDAGGEAWMWVIRVSGGRDVETCKLAIGILVNDFVDNAVIADLPMTLRYQAAVYGEELCENGLRTLASDSTEPEVQAPALYNLAAYIIEQDEATDARREEAVGFLKQLKEKYGELEDPRKRKYGMLADGLENSMNIAVGKPAPEIEGTDLDGVAFKLSDYRGKVVLLDFWGHW